MNVMYLYDGEWPKGATRVLKETRAIAAAGHQVNLIARNAEGTEAVQVEPWMTVWRLPKLPVPSLRYALNFPFFLNPVWLFTIWRVLTNTRPHLIMVCDLPLAPCAVWFGKVYSIPVHFDMGEVYPEFLRSLRLLERQGFVKRLIRTPKLAEWVERYVLRRVEMVYVVSDESRERCVKLGVAPGRVILVGNTPDVTVEEPSHGLPPADIVDLVTDQREILLFVGILIADRGVIDAIRALEIIRTRRPSVALVVVGDGPERPILAKAVEEMGLGASVRLVGWKEPRFLAGYYQYASIGLLPFRDSPHVRLTLANKLFDYMAAGLPVLGSDLPPTRRVLRETGAGVTHVADQPDDLARCTLKMLDDRLGMCAMSDAGRRAVATTYSWVRDAERLCAGVSRAGVC